MKNSKYSLREIAEAVQQVVTKKEFLDLANLLADTAQEKFAEEEENERKGITSDPLENHRIGIAYELGDAMEELVRIPPVKK